MNGRVYIDSSALAKWYLNEKNSDIFVEYLSEVPTALISQLTITEIRSLLARRRRMREINEGLENEIFTTFQMDIDQAHLMVLPFDIGHFTQATHFISLLKDIPLRTLDALHLAIAKYHHVQILATADQTMAAAAEQLELEVKFF